MNYVTDDNGVAGRIGGIIRGYYGRFYNNRRDVEFLSDPYNANSSIFKFCDFKTTRELNSGPIFAHVSMWDVINVRFWGCNFEYAAGSAYADNDRGMGIFSIDASYLLNRYCESPLTSPYPCPSGRASSFKNLTTGIRVDNLAMAQRAPHIYNSEFYDNTQDAIYMHNAQAFTIDQNYIRTADPGANGVYLNNSRFYSVKNNTFTENGAGQTTTGIYAWQSLNGAHEIYRNSFEGHIVAIDAEDNNSGYNNTTDGLKMNCNDFSQTPNMFDIVMIGNGTGLNAPTVKRKQGEVISGDMTATNLVRNQYGASCVNQSKWYAGGAGTTTLVIQHGTNSDAVTQPTPQPACSSTIVNVVASLIPLDYENHCLPYPAHSGGPMTPDNPNSETMGNLNSNLTALIAEGEDADRFELGATMAAKMNCFVLDSSAGSKDSLIHILQHNPGQMPDTDLQLIFAYMHKGDYHTADSLANALGSGRADWKDLLQALIAMYQEPDKLYSLNSNGTYQSLMEDYASDPYRDGSGLAQSILFFVQGTSYTEPRLLPEGVGERHGTSSSIANVPAKDQVRVFPNPTSAGVTLIYSNPETTGPVLVELKDLTGRIIYSNFIVSGVENHIAMDKFSGGIYFITLTRNKELIYRTKIIKQN